MNNMVYRRLMGLRRVKAYSAVVFLVYEVEEKVVGIIRGNYDGSRAIIHQLSVHSIHQKFGIGTALVREVITRFWQLGAPTVSAIVGDENFPFSNRIQTHRRVPVGNW
jgi:predicted N-acetyltransferase YhbS